MSRIHELAPSAAGKGLLQARQRTRNEKWVAASKHDNDCVSRSVPFHSNTRSRASKRTRLRMQRYYWQVLAGVHPHIMRWIYLRVCITLTFAPAIQSPLIRASLRSRGDIRRSELARTCAAANRMRRMRGGIGCRNSKGRDESNDRR